ncbi:MAG TPA: tRNA pseudouridine(55) synthase TruB [Candidatus Limnocylindrales bacterium]|nr:tRNA pseudouridine(55) synthase TruB [Candidatus Limnocylindrales bacterium]
MPRQPDAPGMHGVLVVAKPAGPTSHDVVALVRRLASTRRIGHGGTLDPFASGVLPLFLGGATRLVEYHLADDKAYRATICFGATSTTDDLDGDLTPREPAGGEGPGRAEVEEALSGFVGPQLQRPPVYSAVQVGGRRAYAMARAGEEVDLPARSVEIRSLQLVEWDAADPARPIAIVDVVCTAGTYVRALARDLGEHLGCGAYLGALVRTASGPFTLDRARTLDALRDAAADAGPDGIRALLLPADYGLDALPAVALTDPEIADALQGRYVRPSGGLRGAGDAGPLRLVDAAGTIVGMGRREGARVAPTKMLPR